MVKLYLQTHLITQLWWSTTYRADSVLVGVLGVGKYTKFSIYMY
jgi:hypothetical protein